MQPTQATNPFQQVLDNEAFEILTKCDPKLATAILSIALKKFSETKEFIYFVKPEFKNEFEGIKDERFNVSGNEQDISMNPTPDIQNTAQPQSQQTQSSGPSAVSVSW